MENRIFSHKKIEKLKRANEKLLILDNSDKERDKNIIFVYCPPKVGSTSLVSSIRLFANEKYNVLHLHNEQILKILYDIDVSIMEIIIYNRQLGKNIYVFDIYRTPIEKKISIFFEKLESLHFNADVGVIEKYQIEKLTNRFNNLFPYLGENDYFRNEYAIRCPKEFDFEKKFILVESGGIKYFKLRLSDASVCWKKLLSEILGIDISIIRDYESADKKIGDIYRKFIDLYKIPENLLNLIKADDQAIYYMSDFERNKYFEFWESKKTISCDFYTKKEYDFYIKLSSENQNMNEIQNDHYIDNGCTCEGCCLKRVKIRETIKNGEKRPSKIKHEKGVGVKPQVFIKSFKKETSNKKKIFSKFEFHK